MADRVTRLNTYNPMSRVLWACGGVLLAGFLVLVGWQTWRDIRNG